MNPYGTRRASHNAHDASSSGLSIGAQPSSSLTTTTTTTTTHPKQRRLSSFSKQQRRPSQSALSVSPAFASNPLLSSSMPGTTATAPRKRSQSIGDDGEIKNATKKDKKDYYECEKCSKVYRHSTCLVKHRWEHTSHWKEASKLLLSKHQQVQLLEAAAILQVAGAGSSLPDDKSYWPAAVSPPSSGLLGSQSLNISVLHSSPHLFASRSLQPEMSAVDSEDEDGAAMEEDEAPAMTSSGTEDLADNMFEMDIDEATSDDSSRARSVGQDSGYYGSVKSTAAAPPAAPAPAGQATTSVSPAQPVLGLFAKARPSPAAPLG